MCPASSRPIRNVRPNDTPTGPIARAQVRLSFYNPYSSYNSGADTQFAVPEAWAAIGNVVGSQPSMKFWAGDRFYERKDIYINDFFFRNMSGGGGGVEDIQLPFGQLALAWIGNGSQSDLYQDIPSPTTPANKPGSARGAGTCGSMMCRCRWAKPSSTSSMPTPTPARIRTAIRCSAPTASRSTSSTSSSRCSTNPASICSPCRLAPGRPRPSLPASRRSPSRGSPTSGPTRTTPGGSGPPNTSCCSPASTSRSARRWFTNTPIMGTATATRPGSRRACARLLEFNKYFSLAFEGGVDYVSDSFYGTSGNLFKLTLAPQVALGNQFFSRPVLRAFVTYGHWSDAFVGQVGGQDYQHLQDGLTWGLQMEAWW